MEVRLETCLLLHINLLLTKAEVDVDEEHLGAFQDCGTTYADVSNIDMILHVV